MYVPPSTRITHTSHTVSHTVSHIYILHTHHTHIHTHCTYMYNSSYTYSYGHCQAKWLGYHRQHWQTSKIKLHALIQFVIMLNHCSFLSYSILIAKCFRIYFPSILNLDVLKLQSTNLFVYICIRDMQSMFQKVQCTSSLWSAFVQWHIWYCRTSLFPPSGTSQLHKYFKHFFRHKFVPYINLAVPFNP